MAALKTFFGRKLGMTQIFTDAGECIPVTAIEAPPVTVVDILTQERDGHVRFRVGFDDVKEKALSKPELGVLKKAGVSPKRTLREIPVDAPGDVKPGATITLESMAGVDFVDVVGTTKGRGFAGVVRRYHFSGAPHTHGTSEGDRVPGSLGRQHSIGQGIVPGKRMGGRMGAARRTTKNLEVVKLDPARNLLLVRGAVPGPNGGLVQIREAYKKKVVHVAKPESAKKKKVL
jgi:large subunit ribosomal protein L3